MCMKHRYSFLFSVIWTISTRPFPDHPMTSSIRCFLWPSCRLMHDMMPSMVFFSDCRALLRDWSSSVCLISSDPLVPFPVQPFSQPRRSSRVSCTRCTLPFCDAASWRPSCLFSVHASEPLILFAVWQECIRPEKTFTCDFIIPTILVWESG